MDRFLGCAPPWRAPTANVIARHLKGYTYGDVSAKALPGVRIVPMVRPTLSASACSMGTREDAVQIDDEERDSRRRVLRPRRPASHADGRGRASERGLQQRTNQREHCLGYHARHGQKLLHDMFALGIGRRKIIRHRRVCLIVGLRLAGKRELAQLNPFDLVVLLTISIPFRTPSSATTTRSRAVSSAPARCSVNHFVVSHRPHSG
jgi:hypothetical protein